MTRLVFIAAAVALASSRAAVGQVLPPAVPPSDPQQLPPPIVSAPEPVAGQPRPERPYRGLFGGAGDPVPGLFLLFDAYGGRDSNILANQPGGGGEQPYAAVAGAFGGASGALNYLWVRGETQLSLLGRSEARHYPRFDGDLTHSHSGSLGLEFALGRNFHVAMTQDLEYASFFQLALGPRSGIAAGLAPVSPVSADQALLGGSTVGYDSDVGVVQTLGPRESLRYSFRYRRTVFDLDDRTFTMQGGGASYRRNLTRYAALRLGYGYTQSSTNARRTLRMHNLDTGIDYARPLSFSRRTNIGFTVGSQAFDREEQTLYRVEGTARIAHEMGRSWLLTGAYDRGAQFVEALDEPLYANTVLATLGGLLAGGRLHLTTGASFSDGELTLTTRRRGLKTYSGTADLLWAVSSHWALHTSYGYHYFEFGPGVVIHPQPASRLLRRHSVIVGARMWLPLKMQRGHRGTR